MSKAQAIYLAVDGGAGLRPAGHGVRSVRLLRRPARRLAPGSTLDPATLARAPGCRIRGRGLSRPRSSSAAAAPTGVPRTRDRRALRRGRRCAFSRSPGPDVALDPGHVRLRQGAGPCRRSSSSTPTAGRSSGPGRACGWRRSLDDLPFLRTTRGLRTSACPGSPRVRRATSRRSTSPDFGPAAPGSTSSSPSPWAAPIQGAHPTSTSAKSHGPGRRLEGVPISHADDRVHGWRPRRADHAHATRRRIAPRLRRRFARRPCAVRPHVRHAGVLHQPCLRAGRRRRRPRASAVFPQRCAVHPRRDL